MKRRNYIQARNLFNEAKEKLKDYDAVLGRIKKDYEELRKKGIIRKQNKNTNAKYVLFSFYQMSSAPIKKETEDKKS